MPETDWPYPVIEQGSKLGVHTIRQNRVLEFARTLVEGGTKFPVVKGVDDLGWLLEIKNVSPETLVMARLVTPLESCPGVHFPETDLDEMADDLIEFILDKTDSTDGLREAVDYWEVCNEPDPPGADGYRRLSELMVKCIVRAEQEDLRLGLFALNAGTPEWDEMVAMAESGVFERAYQGGHILAIHEGVSNPHAPIDSWFGDLIPGSPEVEGAGAQCFRYRYLVRALDDAGQPVIPIVVSEWYGGNDPLTPQQIVERMRWYDEKARQDHFLLSFCPFTLGPVGFWETQDYENAYPALVDYMISVKDEVNAKPGEEEEENGNGNGNGNGEEKPCRGLPRVQYDRVYVLLPPDAGQAWAQAVVGATWDDRRYTIGASADDAGIGDLDDRTVVAVNPTEWENDLQDFFETHYPDVRYVTVTADTPDQLAEALDTLDL
jgi:hypothetical protein